MKNHTIKEIIKNDLKSSLKYCYLCYKSIYINIGINILLEA